MINLLPQIEKKELSLKRTKNLVFVLSGSIIVIFVCFILILVSIKFYIMAEISEEETALQTIQQKYTSPEIEIVKNAIQKYNELLPAILSFYQNKIYLSDTLAVLSDLPKAKGLHFTNITIAPNEKNKNVEVSISGVSDTRENLINFQKELEKQDQIKNISFSAQTWINPVNANFSLTLEYGK